MSHGPEGFEGAASELAEKVARAVARSISGENPVAVAFSGGVDSSVLAACAKRHTRVVACTGFSETSKDGQKAAAAAEKLGIELVAVRLTEAAVSRELPKLDLPFQPTIMDRGLWCLYSLVAQSARGAGARVLLLGQLADEQFGGYAKYLRALQVEGAAAAKAMMDADFREYGARGRVRDVGACAHWAEPRFPYEDEEVTTFASSIPLSYKITPTARKAVLRRAAVILGVPDEIAGSDKKAAQYSSGVQKLVAGSPF